MSVTRYGIRGCFAAALFAMCAAAQPAVGQDTLKIAVPQRGAWDTGVAEVGLRGGIFKKHGLNLELLYTQGGPESIQAVISGSMDMAVGVGISAALATYSKGAPIRIIASEMIGSPDLYWYVKPESPIRKVEDFADKTVGYSQNGTSSHAGLLELLQQNNVKAKPTAVGGMSATLPQLMSGQIDVGWAAAPFGLDLVADGKIRIVGRGSDIAALRGRTARVNVAGLPMVAKTDVMRRFMRGYLETIEYMYNDPSALKHYAEYSGLPDPIVLQVRAFIPKETMAPGAVAGFDQAVADAVRLKFLSAPLTAAQAAELIQIPTVQ
ncbi:MAG TPA: ABC transporter substrate-binding protein [Xanthobacteraceae bacterium]|nr:ABC transporter substrate-binding protein [Xanthobacteraceae bacterium]